MKCIICRGKASFAGFFVPNKPDCFGSRILSVKLCRKCERKGKRWWTARVEAELARQGTERN
jgi:hypothetical protein